MFPTYSDNKSHNDLIYRLIIFDEIDNVNNNNSNLFNLDNFIKNSQNYYKEKVIKKKVNNKNYIDIYCNNRFGSWELNGSIKKNEDYIITKEFNIIDNHYGNWIKKWSDSNQRSKINKGRTVLAYGPPGTGKVLLLDI